MNGTRTLMTLAVVLLLAVAGQAKAGSTMAPLSTPELKQAIVSGKKNTVVFFINPTGGPCKAQKQVLEQLLKDRGSSFNIAYINALQEENQRAFYDYGVRSLPTVVLVDKQGRIARFFPPGIQSYETLATALDGIK